MGIPNQLEAQPPRLHGRRRRLFMGLAVGLGVAAAVAAAAVARAERREDGRKEREVAAVRALLRIATAQAQFREADAEGDGRHDYARDLHELGQAGLIDADLARGAVGGYRFTAYASPETPEFLWLATATPVEPGETGGLYLAINHTRVVHHSWSEPHPDRTDGCAFAPGFYTVSK